MEFIKPGRVFDFMGKRRYAFALSLVLFIGSMVSLIYPGPRLGTDFKGGTEVEVGFLVPIPAGEIRAAVERLGFDSPEVVAVNDRVNPNRYLIRVEEVSVLDAEQKRAVSERLCILTEGEQADDRCPPEVRATELKFSPGGDKISVRYDVPPDLTAIARRLEGVPGVELRPGRNLIVNERDHKVEILLKATGDQLLDALRRDLGADKVPESALRVEWIGPKAGAQLRDAAIRSMVISILFIMAYVAFRFDMRFAPGGIVALVHDAGIAVGAMVLTQREFTLPTVAALLTITGYSINDTVVVYDRIRENLTRHRSMSFPSIINLSISETLGRTIITSGVTALSLMAFLWWGTGVLKDFAFTLLVGMVAGTFSTIYVAAPLTEWIDRRFFAGRTAAARKPSRTKARRRPDAVV